MEALGRLIRQQSSFYIDDSSKDVQKRIKKWKQKNNHVAKKQVVIDVNQGKIDK